MIPPHRKRSQYVPSVFYGFLMACGIYGPQPACPLERIPIENESVCVSEITCMDKDQMRTFCKSCLSCAVVTAATGSSNYGNMHLCHYLNDIMERLKAIRCILLRNRERGMLGQLPRWIRRLSGDETTFSAHVLKWCHWSAMGPLSASFLYRLISRKTNTMVS